MADLYDVGVEIVIAREQPCLAGFAGVAHEEFAEVVRMEHDDDAVLIHVVAGIGEKRQ